MPVLLFGRFLFVLYKHLILSENVLPLSYVLTKEVVELSRLPCLLLSSLLSSLSHLPTVASMSHIFSLFVLHSRVVVSLFYTLVLFGHFVSRTFSFPFFPFLLCNFPTNIHLCFLLHFSIHSSLTTLFFHLTPPYTTHTQPFHRTLTTLFYFIHIPSFHILTTLILSSTFYHAIYFHYSLTTSALHTHPELVSLSNLCLPAFLIPSPITTRTQQVCLVKRRVSAEDGPREKLLTSLVQ